MIAPNEIGKRIQAFTAVCVNLQKIAMQYMIDNIEQYNKYGHHQSVFFENEHMKFKWNIHRSRIDILTEDNIVFTLYLNDDTRLTMNNDAIFFKRTMIFRKDALSNFVDMHDYAITYRHTRNGYSLATPKYKEYHLYDFSIDEDDDSATPEIIDDSEEWFSVYLQYGETLARKYALKYCKEISVHHSFIGNDFFAPQYSTLYKQIQALESCTPVLVTEPQRKPFSNLRSMGVGGIL